MSMFLIWPEAFFFKFYISNLVYAAVKSPEQLRAEVFQLY